MPEYLLTAIWPVWDPGLDVHALALMAEPELIGMADQEGVVITDTPRWTLHGDRLSAIVTVRGALPWDETDPDDAARAYVAGLLPDAWQDAA